MRTTWSTAAFCLACTLGLATPVHADAVDLLDGTAQLPALSWERLHGRLSFVTSHTSLRPDLPSVDPLPSSRLSVMGDYYLRPSATSGSMGGLRATSGVLFGQRNAQWGVSSATIGGFGADRHHGAYDSLAPDERSSIPYLGLGYTGTGGSQGKSGSWGYSADLGLMSLSPGNAGRFGKVLNGSQNLDDVVRSMRLSPVVQFSFSYAF